MGSNNQDPKIILIAIILLASIYYLPAALLLSLIFLPIMHRKINKTKLVILAAGFLLLCIEWLLFKITPDYFIYLNQWLRAEVIHGNWQALFNIKILLSSFPIALIYAPIISAIIGKTNSISKELSQISQGKLNTSSDFISDRKAQHALNKISTSAIDDGTVLGINRRTRNTVILRDKDANLHTLAIGTTGCGKTTGLCNIIESAIIRKIPLIYVDGKGDLELLQKIAAFAKQNGAPFYYFSMLGSSLKYNPIASGGITSKKDRIVELRDWSEDHYRKIAEGYLQTVFSILEKHHVLTDLVTLAKYLEPDALYGLARTHKDETIIANIEKLEAKYKDISSLIAEIDNIAHSEIGHLFDCSSGEVLTLEKAFEQNAIVYFCLQPLAFPAYAELMGKLVINDIKSLASQQLNKKSQKKLFTIFDEFSVFAGEQIITLINQGRSAGIHAILSTQSLADIERKGGTALVGQILNNCNNFLIQRQNNHTDAEALANIIGTHDAFQITSQIESRVGGTGVGTIRQTKEFIVHPDDIKRLKRGDAVYVGKQNFGVNWIHFRKSMIG